MTRCDIRIGQGLDDIKMGLGGQAGTRYKQLGKEYLVPHSNANVQAHEGKYPPALSRVKCRILT